MTKECAICGSKIGFLDQDLTFKDGIICSKEIKKYGFAKKAGSDVPTLKAINWADKHTISELKEFIANGDTFPDIIKRQNIEKINAKVAKKHNKQTKIEKICFNCGSKIGFWDQEFDLKDGFLCGNCWQKYHFSSHVSERKMSEYIETISIAECQNLINNPDALDDVKIKYGYVKHFWENDKQAKEKGKDKLEQGKIKDQKIAEEQAKAAALTKKYEELLPIFQQECSAKFGKYLFDDTRRQILRKKSFLFDPEFYNYSDIISYRINQQGHNENKKHGITRALVGGALAGGVGAIVGATTGGKQTDYIDHLGIIVNLKNGNNFEIVFIRKIDEIKSNSFTARSIISDVNSLISLLDAIIAKNQSLANTTISSNNQAKVDSTADEIRKYKKLADDGIITQDEFSAKKKQLLGL